jgi:hypothetical protein
MLYRGPSTTCFALYPAGHPAQDDKTKVAVQAEEYFGLRYKIPYFLKASLLQLQASGSCENFKPNEGSRSEPSFSAVLRLRLRLRSG